MYNWQGFFYANTTVHLYNPSMQKKFLKYLGALIAIVSILMLVFLPKSRYYQIIVSPTEIYDNPMQQVFNYKNEFESSEIALAKKLLPLVPNLPTIQKVLAIEEFIFDTIQHAIKPVDIAMPNSIALQYLQNSMNHQIKPDCGAYTQIMNLFFTANQIKYRRVGVANIPDITIGNHVFSEVYFPENKEWAYTDMNTNKLLIQDSVGHFKNTIQIQQAVLDKNFSGAAIVYVADTTKLMQWQNTIGNEKKCLLPTVDYHFYYQDHVSKFTKLKMLLYPMPWYASFTQSYQATNTLFWIRLCFTYIALILLSISFFISSKK